MAEDAGWCHRNRTRVFEFILMFSLFAFILPQKVMRWVLGSQMTPKMRIQLIRLLGKSPTSVFYYMAA